MTDDSVRIEAVEKSPEERLIDLERAKVGLESDLLQLKKNKLDYDKAVLELDKLKIKDGFEMLNLRVARLSGTVTSETVEKTRTQLYFLSQANPGEPLTLDINSPGGSVSAGMELFGIVRELSDAGHHMTTRISGEACSMGGVIAQSGDTRQIRAGSYLHLHEASWGSSGKASEMRESADYVERISKDISKIYAKRSEWSAKEIYERLHRREWWLDAEEALEIGFVDEIV